MRKKGDTRTAKRATASYAPYVTERRKRSVNVASRRKKTMETAARSQALDELAEEVITDPETIKSIERGLEDLKAGRVKPWKEVKRNV